MQAGMLVTSVMKDRGYPTEDHDQIQADLSVEHSGTLDHFRAAHQINMQAEEGTAHTENLRLAMLHYRALFSDLLGPPSEDLQPGPPAGAAAEPSPGTAPATAPGAGAGANTRPPVTEPRSRPSS